MIGTTSSNVLNETSIIDEYLIKVVDYDGTIIDEKYMHNGEVYTLPQAPSHNGLVFQEWSCSQAITNNQIIVNDNTVMIGPIYTTVSGQSEFDIELTKVTGLTFTLNMNGTKNWGDGTTDTNTSHTYADYGEYSIKCNGSSITDVLFGQDSSSPNYTVKNVKLANITNLINNCFLCCYSLTTITIPKSVISVGSGVFNGCASLISAILPNNITSIGNLFFNDCNSLKSIVLPSSLTSIGSEAICYCRSLPFISIPSDVTTIGNNQFYYCMALQTLILPKNLTVINSSLVYTCYSLTNIKMPNKITSLGNYAFQQNYSLSSDKVYFYNISNISSYAFANCPNLLLYDFRSLTSIPTLSSIETFRYISSLCKIKVPWDLYQAWIVATNWSTYADYIDGGTPATINFNLISGTPDIYVNNNLISGTTIDWVGSIMPYYCYDSTNNILLPPTTKTGITEASTQSVDIDMSISNSISLSTEVSNLNVTFNIDGLFFNIPENSDETIQPGTYTMNIIGSGTTVNYYIDGGTNYMDVGGSIITTGSDINEPVTLTPCTIQTFTRPDLTANGTVGGNAFAVLDPNSTSSNAWRAMDSNTTTSYYWNGSTPYSGSKEFIFYNPNPLNVTGLTFYYTSTSYYASGLRVQGSNDNINWEDITTTYSGSSTTYTATLTNDKYYKYYKLIFSKPVYYGGYYVRIYNLLITASEKVATV